MRARVAKDAESVLDAIRGGGPSSARQLAGATGLNDGRVRFALAYLLGARAVAEIEPEHGGFATRWAVTQSPEFDHTYAAIEDVVETLVGVVERTPRPIRSAVEQCLTWMNAALRRIDGEPVD